MTIDKRLNDVLARVFKVPVESIHPNISMENVASWDSLSHIRLICALEEEFGITFKPNEAITLIDYHSMRNLIQKNLKS